MAAIKRIRRFWRAAIRPWWYDYEWPFIGGLALAVVVLGCIGFRLQLLAEKKPVELVDLIFKSFLSFHCLPSGAGGNNSWAAWVRLGAIAKPFRAWCWCSAYMAQF
jgi:hypothetical protein